MIWITLSLLLSIFLETNFINIPLTFAVIVFWAVVNQENEIFIFSFLAGLLLDLLTFNFLGLSSVFLLISTFIIFLYRSKFEIRTVGFVGTFSFLGSICFLILKGSGNILLGSILLTLIEIVAFKIYQKNILKK